MNNSRNPILALAGCLTTALLTVLLLPALLLMSIVLSLFGTKHGSYMFYKRRKPETDASSESGDESTLKINSDGSIEVKAKSLDGEETTETYPKQ